MKRSWRIGAVGLLLVPAVMGCDALTGRRTAATTFTAALTAEVSAIPADLRSTARLALEVKSNNNTAPTNAQVEFTTSSGVLLAADGSGTGMGRLTIPLSGTVAVVALKCASSTNQPIPAPGAPPVTARINAKLLANGGDVASDVAATAVAVTCEAVADSSQIAFISPQPGTPVTDPDRVAVQFQATDFDQTPHANTNVIITVMSPNVRVSDTQTGGPSATQTLTVPTNASGAGTFFVLYPGDEITRAGPVTVTLEARYINSLVTTKTATLTFPYNAAPNLSSVSFVELEATAGAPAIAARADGTPFVADLAANSADAVTATVELRDRAGGMPPEGTVVRFTCTSGSNSDLCNALEGISPFTPDAGTVSNLPVALALSVNQPANATRGARSVATVVYRVPANSTPGSVTLAATFRPLSAASDTGSLIPVNLNLVDNSAVRVTITPIPSTFRSTETGVVDVGVRRGTTGLADREVCVTLDQPSQVRATLSDSSDDNGVNTLTMPTNATGGASVRVVPRSTAVRGPVTLEIVVVDLAHDTGRDTTNQPCRNLDPSAQTFTQTVQIDRDPVLASLVYTSAEPNVLGIRGSSLATTSRVVFRLTNDENAPVVGQQVDFVLDNNRDPTASITPFGLTDASGEASAYLAAGDQAASLVILASATRVGVTVSASSDPVAVVGGKPAWSQLSVGSTGKRVFAAQETTGYRNAFGATSRPEPPTVILAQLVDRFSNRVAREGYQVQLRAETGSIPSTRQSDADGLVNADYIPGPPFGMDTARLSGEPREAYAYDTPHVDPPHPVYRTGNERDGRISILVATRGEESFVDANGDGAYQTGESFADLPEPFLDKNEDGLRANCDLPVDRLPVHHDLSRKLQGIGTYCNPYFDDPAEQPASDTITGVIENAAQCRQHWCPDWDPQWNCWDNNSALASVAQPRTPEASRIVWCPHWRYRDVTFENDLTGAPLARVVNGTPAPSVVLPGGATAPLGVRSVGQGYVVMPGITAVVPGDTTAISASGVTGTITWNNTGTYGALAYRAPGEVSAGPAIALNPMTPVVLLQSGAAALHVTTDAALFLALRTAAGAAVTSMAVDMRVERGDLRAPFDDFGRSQLRLAQTDQFIDGNNNGVWDDVNGLYDEDILIWKTVVLLGNSYAAFNTEDWRYAGPRSEGLLAAPNTVVFGSGAYADDLAGGSGLVRLYDRLHSFVHVVPTSAEELADGAGGTGKYLGSRMDTVDASNPYGGGDFFVHGAGSSSTIRVRIVDANGVPVCPYDTGVLTVTVSGTGPNDEAILASPSASAGCSANGVYDIGILTAPTENFILKPPAQVRVELNYTYDTQAGEVVTQTFAVNGETYSR